MSLFVFLDTYGYKQVCKHTHRGPKYKIKWNIALFVDFDPYEIKNPGYKPMCKKIEVLIQNHEKFEKNIFFSSFKLVFKECFWGHFEHYFRSIKALKWFGASFWDVLKIPFERYLPTLLEQKATRSYILHSRVLTFTRRRAGKRLKKPGTGTGSLLQSFRMYLTQTCKHKKFCSQLFNKKNEMTSSQRRSWKVQIMNEVCRGHQVNPTHKAKNKFTLHSLFTENLY